MKFDQDKFVNLYKTQDDALNSSQASGLRTLLGFLEQDKDINDMRWAAYMLATVKHECANQWQPIEEYGKGEGQTYGEPVPVKGSDGKTYTNRYYGRGYVQLTWKNKYETMSHNLNLGDQLVIHPERALEPAISYRIMSFGMRNGSFTGVGLGDFINGSKCDYYNARRVVNYVDQAAKIQGYAQKLEALLRESSIAENGQAPPQGWKDDGTTLTAPNGIGVVKGFRQYLLGHSWRADDWPLEPEHGQNPLELSNPSIGGGTQQVFRRTVLEWTPKQGIFEAWVGQELLELRKHRS